MRVQVPKKTRLYVEQTGREREHAGDMHRTFQVRLGASTLCVVTGLCLLDYNVLIVSPLLRNPCHCLPAAGTSPPCLLPYVMTRAGSHRTVL